MAKIKVRARAVDMLGRQQIAGIPTAIHELFKNSHDAYAKNVEVDYFREDRLLVIRDDGHGMTKQELEERWLTLGTENKIDANYEESIWPELLGLPKRPVMGEKGIGRLAIAAIGPQVLVVTRKITPNGFSPLSACLVNWRMFEIPGIDVDEIEIPTIEITSGDYPNNATLRELADKIRANLVHLKGRVSKDVIAPILDELNSLSFSPAAFVDYIAESNADAVRELRELRELRGNSHGTHFFILPTYNSLDDDIDIEEEDVATPLKKNLLGFSNTMVPLAEDPQFKAFFRDHRLDGTVNELIAKDNFLLPEEFKSADHHFTGRFNEFGQFTGEVKIYGEEAITYTLPWHEYKGIKTECGAFNINVAYVQGKADETRLPHEDWARLISKLDKIGGLYIYRDGIRILPYGNSDHDFLNIERRRTKSAQDWFFSYRRMFGTVEISYKENFELQEKAGREGFRTNTAYRQFRSILENFFRRLAVEFFRPSADYGEGYNRVKAELQERKRLLKKKEEMFRNKKREFIRGLNNFFTSIELGEPVKKSGELDTWLNEEVQRVENISDPEIAGRELLKLEKTFGDELKKIKRTYTIERPRGVGLTKKLNSEWRAYQNNVSKLEASHFSPLKEKVDTIIAERLASKKVVIDRRRRLTDAITLEVSSYEAALKRLRSSLEGNITELSQETKRLVAHTIQGFQKRKNEIIFELETTNINELSVEGFEHYRKVLLGRVEDLGSEEINKLEKIKNQFDAVVDAIREGESIIEISDAAEDETLFAKDELNAYAEFAQSGMALGIIQHEFSSTVNSVRNAIRLLKPWADGTPELAVIHEKLRSSFEHLDGYLTLFTPLNRRLYRTPVTLSGEEISKYVKEIFKKRLERHNVNLISTDSFREFTVNCYPSSFLPVFINIIDNAIYWINYEGKDDGWIKMDVENDSFYISNNGPGIADVDAERIFEFGESNKIGGRGMGLYISRRSLEQEGWEISLESAGKENSPIFKISPK